jgi:PPK2 family polyphosphate:nucleotide phosphotransferase
MTKLSSNREIERFIKPFKVTDGGRFKLRNIDPDDTGGLKSKAQATELLAAGVKQLAELQDKLYAQDKWALLLIFQAMDAAGKDGTIKHVMSGVNPTGCQVFSFKAPSAEELDHDFMWRTLRCLPERGRIGIFNRSYYEEMLVVRVHPELLHAQKLPPVLVTDDIWKERFEDVRNIEHYLSRNGVVIRKFYLHVSKEEQRRRFLERLHQDDKNWKFSMGDAKERNHWNDYQEAYEDMIQHTATEHAPWYVVPADHKWFTRLVVAGAIVDALQDLELHYPTVDAHKRDELALVQAELEQESDGQRQKGRKRAKGKSPGPATRA